MAEDRRAAMMQGLQHLEHLMTFAKYFEASLSGAGAVLRPLRDTTAQKQRLEKVAEISASVVQLDDTQSAPGVLVEKQGLPHDAVSPKDLQEAARAALQQLEEFQAAATDLQELKAVLEETCTAAATWGQLVADDDEDGPSQDDHQTPVTLASLPAGVLRSIARLVGKDMRLVSKQICQLYGSPGTRVVIPHFGHTQDPYASIPDDFGEDEDDFYAAYAMCDDLLEYDYLEPVPESCMARIRNWPCPEEVVALQVHTVNQAEGYPQLLELLMATFSSVKAVTTAGAEHVHLLRSPLTSLAVDNPNHSSHTLHLDRLTHLTALQDFGVVQCNLEPESLSPLASFSHLTRFSISDTMVRGSPYYGSEIWVALSRLPRLQDLCLGVPIDMGEPVPAEAGRMAALTAVTLTSSVLQRHVGQVLQLFPIGLQELQLRELTGCFNDPGANPSWLSQALAGLRCKNLSADFSYAQVNDRAVDAARLAAALAGAMPHLLRLDLDVAIFGGRTPMTGIAEGFRALFRSPSPLQHLSLAHASDALEPVALLNSVARNIAQLTSLTLHSEVFAGAQLAPQPSCARGLSSLQRLELRGYHLIRVFAPRFTRLVGLKELHLRLDAVRDYDYTPQGAMRRYMCPCLPATCKSLTALGSLELLSVDSAWFAASPTTAVGKDAEPEVVCWLAKVRQLRRLRELSLYCGQRVTGADVAELLPAAAALTSIKLRGRDAAALEGLKEALQGHAAAVEMVLMTY